MAFCKIVLTNSSQRFSGQELNSLSYAIPEDLEGKLAVGSLVLVPFRNHKQNALVIDIYKTLSEEEKKFRIREIEEIISDQAIYKQELLDLIKFVSEYYCCSFPEVVNAVLPSDLIKKPDRLVELKISQEELSAKDLENKVVVALLKARKNQAKWARLKSLSGLKEAELKSTVRKLQQRNIVDLRFEKAKSRNAKKLNPIDRLKEIEAGEIPELTDEQKQVYQGLSKNLDSDHRSLIHGVTGSGKTEIYLRLIADTLKKNKSSIVLVPEISLAPQLVERISQRFGKENVLIWHSALTKSEKEYTFSELMTGEPKVVVGARSAIFAPVQDLGLIVIDEEHENSYKQESPAPRYHARTLAEKRAELNNCPLVFGSATPSIELYYKAKSSEYPNYHLYTLTKRVYDNPLPDVKIIDMRQEFNNANKSIFSRLLKDYISQALEKEEQVILFLNKRGSASHVFCRNCGFVYKCNHCDSKTVYHSDRQLMVCHHCGFSEAHPDECPECSSSAIKFFGLGTQKLEAQTRQHFPEARVERLDSDVTRVKHSYIEILDRFKSGEIDILVGTQMIAKGLDLPNLTVVGVISADSNFSQLDYQADERGFQLLTQVAGRAGRADKEGSVIFQTYLPDRDALIDAKKQDYEDFYEKEINLRQEFSYPPFGSLIRFVASSPDEVKAISACNEFHANIYDLLNDQEVSISGPSPALLSKLKNKYRYHILLKFADLKNQELIEQIKEEYMRFPKQEDLSFTIDIDNISLF